MRRRSCSRGRREIPLPRRLRPVNRSAGQPAARSRNQQDWLGCTPADFWRLENTQPTVWARGTDPPQAKSGRKKQKCGRVALGGTLAAGFRETKAEIWDAAMGLLLWQLMRQGTNQVLGAPVVQEGGGDHGEETGMGSESGMAAFWPFFSLAFAPRPPGAPPTCSGPVSPPSHPLLCSAVKAAC